MNILTTTKETFCTGQTFPKEILPTCITSSFNTLRTTTTLMFDRRSTRPILILSFVLNLGWLCSYDLPIFKFLEVLLRVDSSMDSAYTRSLDVKFWEYPINDMQLSKCNMVQWTSQRSCTISMTSLIKWINENQCKIKSFHTKYHKNKFHTKPQEKTKSQHMSILDSRKLGTRPIQYKI